MWLKKKNSCPWSYKQLDTCCSKLLRLCPTLWDPMDHSPPDSSVHRILQARILEWVAIPFFRGSSWFTDRTCVSYVYVVFVVQSPSCVWLTVTLWTVASQVSLSFTISLSLRRLMPIESVMPSNHLILCHPLLLFPSIFSSIRVFSSESALHIRWPKYWSFSFSISPSNEYSGLISFRNDWFEILAVQGTLKSLLQQHSSKPSALALTDQSIKVLSINSSVLSLLYGLSHPYMTTGKTIALTIQTFVGDVISLLFSILSRFIIAFLTRSKCLLIS